MSNTNEGIVVPGESQGSSLNPGVYEEQARKKGWKPLDEFKGNEADWVDAKEFLGREKLYDKIKDLKGDLHRQQVRHDKTLEEISHHMAKTEERAFERAKKELQAQRREAMRNEDPDKVEKIEADLEQLEKDRQAAIKAVPKVQQNSGPTPAFQEWQSGNQWFKLGSTGMPENEMTSDAIAIGTGYAAANPNLSHAQVLEHVSKKIKQMYPNEFESTDTSASQPQRKQPLVESASGGNRNSGAASKKLKVSKSDLTDDQQRIMTTIVRSGVLKAKAEKNKVSQEQQYLMDLAETL